MVGLGSTSLLFNFCKKLFRVYNAGIKYMIQRKSTFFLGFFIFLLPFLGFTAFWKTTFVVFSGLALIALSVKFAIPKKISRSKTKKEKSASVFMESKPFPKVEITEEKITEKLLSE